MATPTGQIPFRMKGQTTCIDHKGRQLDLYCEKCNTLLCVKCLLTIHKGHDVCELSETTPKTKQDITNFIKRIEQSDLVQLKEYIASTDTLLKDNTSNFETLSHELIIQTDKLKQDMDMLTAKSLSLYRKMEADNAKLIQKYKQDLEMHDKQLTQQLQECKKALQRGSHIEIYDAGCEIYSKISLHVKPVLDTASFTPNKSPQHHLELALGKTVTSGQDQAATDQDGSARTSDGQELSSTPQQSEPKGAKAVTMYKLLPKSKVVETWKCSCSIACICPTTAGQAWTKFLDTLTLMDRKGRVIQEVNHKAYITGISLSPTTHTLWASDTENNILELISGRLTHRFSTKEELKCICVTASNHVIVGMAKHVSKFTPEGKMVLTTMDVEKPYRISECPVTHNLAVVDDGYGQCHVIVMDSDFNEQFVYGGEIPSSYKQASHKGAEPFYTESVVYDSVGNILIGDFKKHRILLISGDGEFLRIIHKDTTVTRTVGVDREDVLWAVFGSSEVRVLQYSSR